jgi:hypothetical protein
MGRYAKTLLEFAPTQQPESALTTIKQRVMTSTATRMVTYREINRELSVHPAYTCTDIPESSRISLSRMRLSSHYLRIETGRWSRMPKEKRTCICGNIQTEEHVLISCRETEPLRAEYSTLDYSSLHDLMGSDTEWELSVYCQKVLMKMDKNY